MVDSGEAVTPAEQIASDDVALRQALIVELNDRIESLTPSAFEQLVLDVLQAMGYGPRAPAFEQVALATLGSTA